MSAPSTVAAYPEVAQLPPLLSPRQLAEFIGVSESYVNELVRAGRIYRLPLGERRTRIPRQEVYRLLTPPEERA